MQSIGGESLVLDVASNQIHQLNETATWIFQHCDGLTPIDTLASELAQRYSIELERAHTDLRQTLDQLIALNLIQSED